MAHNPRPIGHIRILHLNLSILGTNSLGKENFLPLAPEAKKFWLQLAPKWLFPITHHCCGLRGSLGVGVWQDT